MANQAHTETIVVIGLGRFGSALAQELHTQGHDVMGIDRRAPLVDASIGFLTFAEVADATDSEALLQLGVDSAGHAVVAIGDAIQASILATATLADLGVPDIWAKAQTEQHMRILERVGAHHTVLPEADMGKRMAHRITGKMIDYMAVDEGFVLIETTVPERYVGKSLADADIRDGYSVTVVCHKPHDGSFTHTTAETVLEADDLILVAGQKDKVEKFANLT